MPGAPTRIRGEKRRPGNPSRAEAWRRCQTTSVANAIHGISSFRAAAISSASCSVVVRATATPYRSAVSVARSRSGRWWVSVPLCSRSMKRKVAALDHRRVGVLDQVEPVHRMRQGQNVGVRSRLFRPADRLERFGQALLDPRKAGDVIDEFDLAEGNRGRGAGHGGVLSWRGARAASLLSCRSGLRREGERFRNPGAIR